MQKPWIRIGRALFSRLISISISKALHLMQNLSEQEASQLGKQIKSRTKARSKTSVAKAAPLKHTESSVTETASLRRSSRVAYVSKWDPNESQPSDAKRLLEIERQIDSVSALPRSSKYAQHRLKVLKTAERLLQQG